MHYKADMFAIKSDLKEIARERRELGDAAVDCIVNFLWNFLTLYGPMMVLGFLALFCFTLRMFAFRIKLFQEDISLTGGMENHQHVSLVGNTVHRQNKSTGGTKNHQHDSLTALVLKPYIYGHSVSRLVKRRRACRGRPRSSRFKPQRVRYIVFALFRVFALGLRANASVAIPA